MKVYIAGPMRGKPENNFLAFDEAREKWKRAGHIVFCPAAIFRAMPYRMECHDRSTLNHVALQDLTCITQCDAIALLEGWEKSVGATMEVALSRFLRMPAFDATTMEEMIIAQLPWDNDSWKEILKVARQWQEVNRRTNEPVIRIDDPVSCIPPGKVCESCLGDKGDMIRTLHVRMGNVTLCRSCYVEAGNDVR